MGELDTAACSQDESPTTAQPTPRLSILHLMLWTACSAVYLALSRAIYALQGDSPSVDPAIRDTSNVLQGIIVGAVWAGTTILAFSRARHGPPMLRQPGHWVLFIAAVSSLITMPVLVVRLLLGKVGVLDTWSVAVFSVIYLFESIAYAFAARCNRGRRWKFLFVGLAAVALTNCLFYLAFGLAIERLGLWIGILSAIPSLGSLLLAGTVLLLSLVDLFAGNRRDWLHWTGVTSHVAAQGVRLLWQVAS